MDAELRALCLRFGITMEKVAGRRTILILKHAPIVRNVVTYGVVTAKTEVRYGKPSPLTGYYCAFEDGETGMDASIPTQTRLITSSSSPEEADEILVRGARDWIIQTYS